MLCLDLTPKTCHRCVSRNLVAGKIMASSMASAFLLMTSRVLCREGWQPELCGTEGLRGIRAACLVREGWLQPCWAWGHVVICLSLLYLAHLAASAMHSSPYTLPREIEMTAMHSSTRKLVIALCSTAGMTMWKRKRMPRKTSSIYPNIPKWHFSTIMSQNSVKAGSIMKLTESMTKIKQERLEINYLQKRVDAKLSQE